MPYITEERRELLLVQGEPAETPGDLNYLITQLCINYYYNHIHNYQTLNDIVGALECAKTEFYRRLAVPYEEQKRRENGDVFGEDWSDDPNHAQLEDTTYDGLGGA